VILCGAKEANALIGIPAYAIAQNQEEELRMALRQVLQSGAEVHERLSFTTLFGARLTCDAVFVPLQDRLEQAAAATGTEHWLFDGVHPNAAGQWLIAKTWLEQVARA